MNTHSTQIKEDEQLNLDKDVVRDFGNEWRHFDQSELPPNESTSIFSAYFSIFPWDDLPGNAVGIDVGCGSGRWALHVAPRVGMLHCIDPSEEALNVARSKLHLLGNCQFHKAGTSRIPIPDGTLDFGYSLGVLHHVPDTALALQQCVAKLKVGAPFLVYLYYAFDNRSGWFRALWRCTDYIRRIVSKLPFPMKLVVTTAFAVLVYWPLSRLAWMAERLGINVDAFPLAAYRDKSFYTMRTDALDRFGTRLEQRFTAAQIRQLMESAGLTNIRFSESVPYWCAVGTKT